MMQEQGKEKWAGHQKRLESG